MSNIDQSRDCIHCGLCTAKCSLLSKYGVDIGQTESLRTLAHKCFLCGECSRVCPEGIDGRAIMLELREAICDEDLGVVKQKYSGAYGEKADYKFRNYKRATNGTVYFPGCNFPSLYPRTSEYISKVLKDKFGIGTVYDCCGKPIGDLGDKEGAKAINSKMESLIEEYGITEFVTACPNCKDYLDGKISVKVTDIYTKLKELGLGGLIEQDLKVYVPCPDRNDGKWLEAASAFVSGEISKVENVMCCGLGAMARVEEPELANELTTNLKEEVGDAQVHTYCASCVGQFTRNGVKVKHLLPEILGTGEKPDTKFSYINRMKTKSKK